MTQSIRLLSFALLMAFCTNCKKATDAPVAPYVPPQPMPPAATKTYLALGDSYTIGQSVPAAQSFPLQTMSRLNSAGINMPTPAIIATTGWTTENLAAAIAAQQPLPHYDVVSLLIGVNDQYQRHDTTGYRGRFAALLATAVDLAGAKPSHVFVLSIPDYSVTPFAQGGDTAFIRKQLDQFNAINKKVTAEKNCTYLDITPSTRAALNDPTLIAGDGLHPSGAEYKIWTDMLAPLMQAVLK